VLPISQQAISKGLAFQKGVFLYPAFAAAHRQTSTNRLAEPNAAHPSQETFSFWHPFSGLRYPTF
jgi:hypothetical protein